MWTEKPSSWKLSMMICTTALSPKITERSTSSSPRRQKLQAAGLPFQGRPTKNQWSM
ncbi:hypothetical protein AB205_0148980 [Aquarana catesbeiana]|uniref:Uncharacterized protein n=1 Tax=Aquarana catesbeiana TaxID=8400 RepID=A0A2G9QL51_AQUCT|nr:hypothetical protein AB205_0148980 [Aquarana catesbeiana]